MKVLAAACRLVVLIGACAAAAACGKPTSAHPELGTMVPVRGRLTVEGKPVPLAQVVYLPIPEGDGRIHSPSGQTDRDGHYELSVFGNPGAPPGRYAVGVLGGAPDGPAVAARYRDPKTSGVTREVAANAAPGAY